MDNSTSGSTTNTNEMGGIMNSESLVSKIAFLLLVIFLFVITLQFGMSLLSWFFNNTGSPHLINGMVDAKQTIVIPQAPSKTGSKTIYRSANANGGL